MVAVRQDKSPILIIDDEFAIREFLARGLEKYGYSVDPAESGEQGIEKIDLNRYSLILTDMKMPGLSGSHVLKYVKAQKGEAVPVIGMSGTPWLMENEAFDAVLSKPFRLKEAVGAINQCIR